MIRAITVYRSSDNSTTVYSSADAIAAAQADPENDALKEWREVLLIEDVK